MYPVDPGGQDEFCTDDAHCLALEVCGDGADKGGVVEEALMANTDVGGEAGL